MEQIHPKYENVYAALTVEGERAEIKISSHAVCLASPVWRKALTFPRLVVEEDSEVESLNSYSEPPVIAVEKELALHSLKPTGNKIDEFELVPVNLRLPEWVDLQQHATAENHAQFGARRILDLTEDDADSVLLLLRIAHLHFEKVPLKLPFNSLLTIAELCDYYDCTALVQPWRSLWFADAAVESMKPGHEKWLTIAWVFREDTIFNKLAGKVVRKVEINDKHECIINKGEIFAPLLPLGIVDDMINVHDHTIQALLDLPYSFIDSFVTATAKNTTICDDRDEKSQCDALTYGSLLLKLQSLQLWPRKSSTDINISINNLVEKLKAVKVIPFPSRYGCHGRCGIRDYRESISSVTTSIPGPKLSSYPRHMPDMRNLLLQDID